MSLCDRCFTPGACCRSFILNDGTAWHGQTMLEVMAGLADVRLVDDRPLPFAPLFRNRNGIWWFWCTNLRRDGRCGDYDRRPLLCREFEPASDPLCTHFGGAEGVDLSVAAPSPSNGVQ